MTKPKHSEKGFTIIELLIAVSVASMASILIMYTFVFMYGSLLREQTRANMVLETQVFLKKIVEDVRVANQILTTNSLTDLYQPTGGWVTSDPANIMVLTQPVVDSDKNFIYDLDTGYPYQNEIVYFGNSNDMYRRTIANSGASGNATTSTCPAGTTSCLPDIRLTSRLQSLFFVFYDTNDTVTTVPEDARSVEFTITLRQRIYGNDVIVSNKTRVTLRNEN